MLKVYRPSIQWYRSKTIDQYEKAAHKISSIQILNILLRLTMQPRQRERVIYRVMFIASEKAGLGEYFND
jgi:hypothetical protein